MRGSTCKGEGGGGGGHAPNPWKTPSSLAMVLRYTLLLLYRRVRDLASEDDEKTQKLLKHSLITEH